MTLLLEYLSSSLATTNQLSLRNETSQTRPRLLTLAAYPQPMVKPGHTVEATIEHPLCAITAMTAMTHFTLLTPPLPAVFRRS